MDETDVKLLKILSEDASKTATEMMPQLNLSIPAINKRIARLRRAGILERYTILVNAEKIGKPVQAFILVVLQPFSCMEELLQFVNGDPDILECYAVTGEYDYILKVCAHDIGSFEQKLLSLKGKKGVVKSYTMLSLQEYKHLPSPLPDET